MFQNFFKRALPLDVFCDVLKKKNILLTMPLTVLIAHLYWKVHYKICSWIPFKNPPHRSGRPREINFISRYICFSQIGPFDVCMMYVCIFGGTKIPPFWLFLAPPADPVEFFWFKMAGKGVPHIDTCSMLDSHL